MVRATKNATSSQPESLPGRAAAIKGQGEFRLGLRRVNQACSTMASTLVILKRKVFIQHVLTHKEYDRGTWKDD